MPVVVIVLVSLLSYNAWAALPCGPAENPYEYPDFGGTPDLIVADGTGLGYQELKTLLDQLGQGDKESRRAVVSQIRRDAAGSEGVLRAVLFEHPAPWASAMVRTILEARKRAGQLTGDRSNLLEGLLSISPNDSGWGRTAVTTLRIYTLILSLWELHSMEAYKTLIDYSVEKEGVFRVEIGNLLTKIGFDTLPAVIYAEGSPSNAIREHAEEWFSALDSPLLSEQVVQLKNPRRLAQLLEAYAANRDRDAIEVTLSMTNHDSSIVRNAARCCLPAYGRYIKWPVRRLYENTFEMVAPAEEPVELLEQMYQHFDRQRDKPVEQLMQKGLARASRGEFEAMALDFRKVLAKRPAYTRRVEMAAPLHEFALDLIARGELEQARNTLALAERVADADGPDARQIRAELRFLRAERYRADGIVSAALYEKVLELNPEHTAARGWYEKLTREGASLGEIALTGAIVSLLILLAVFMVLARLRDSRN